KTNHPPCRSGTGIPGLTGVAREATTLIAGAHQHDLRILGANRYLAIERFLEITYWGKSSSTVAADTKLSSGGSVYDGGVGRMESRPAAGIASQLGMMNHPPIMTAIFGQIGCAHVAVDHHQVGIGGGDSRREHPSTSR